MDGEIDPSLMFLPDDVGFTPRRPFYGLFSISAIVSAGCFSGVLGGFSVLALNYFKLKSRGLGVVMFVIGMLLAAAAIGAIPFVVEFEREWQSLCQLSIYLLAQMFGGALVSGLGAWALQGRALAYHRGTGGAFFGPASVAWQAALFGIFYFGLQAIIGYPIFSQQRIFYFRPNQRLVVDTEISKKKALRFSERIQAHGIFQGDVGHGQDIVVAKSKGRYEIIFFILEDALKSPDIYHFCRDIRDDCALDPFDDAPVDVILQPANGGKRIVIGPP